MHTYTSDTERVRALEAAHADYARSGVFTPPVPAAVAAYRAIRYHRPAWGVTRPDPPAEVAAPGPDPQQVAQVLRESAGSIDHANAAGAAARALRAAGLTAGQTAAALAILDELLSPAALW